VTPNVSSESTSPRRTPVRPDFHHLTVFLKVVETRSFAAAARQLGRSQPAVSQTIARLEEIYGGDLFERRRGAPLALTPIGEAILPSARVLLYTVDHQMVRAAATAQSRRGTLTIGFLPGLASGPLRSGLYDFAHENPDVHIRMAEDFPGSLHRQLNQRTIDIMIAAHQQNLSQQKTVQEPLWNERLLLALHADHALATQLELRWDDVASLPVLLRTSDGETSAYRTLLARVGQREIDVEQHDVSRETLIAMISMGWGATLVFESAVIMRPDVAYRPIAEANAFVPIDAVWPSADRNPLRHKLLRHIRHHVDRLDTAAPLTDAKGQARDHD